MRKWAVAMVMAIAGIGVAAQSLPRVRHLDRFPTDSSVNSGSWILEPDSLRGLPSTQECAADSESPHCGLVEVGALGGSSWPSVVLVVGEARRSSLFRRPTHRSGSRRPS